MTAQQLPASKTVQQLGSRLNAAESALRRYLPEGVDLVQTSGGINARCGIRGRGDYAWLFPAPAICLAAGLPNQLHTHATNDKTALERYVPAAREWINWCSDTGYPVATVSERDMATADYLSYLLYEEDEGISHGKLVASAIPDIYPEMRGNMSHTARALQAWGRLEQGGEGEPCTWEEVGAMSQEMLDGGHEEAADLTLLAADGYLRQSDWHLIRREDVHFAQGRVAIVLGDPSRGDTTKTGARQGIIFDYPGSVNLIRKYYDKTRPGDRLFKLNPAQFSRIWRGAAKKLGWWAGPPHVLRHVGPSYDALVPEGASGPYRTLKQIQVRGRWRTLSGVLRYQKAFMLLKAMARVPEWIRVKGGPRLLILGERASAVSDQ